MKTIVRLGALAVCSMLAFAACGSPTDNLSFKPPVGWEATPSIAGLMQAWQSPDKKQTLMLMRLPVAVKTEDLLKNANVNNAKVDQQKEITICGNQPAKLMSMVADRTENGKTTSSRMDGVVTGVAGATYFAMYAREVNAPADSAAEDAIRSVCEKK